MGQTSDLAATPANEPSYRVGQDRGGRWLAMDVMGRAGGMFVSRDAALKYALAETMREPGRVTFSVEPVAFV